MVRIVKGHGRILCKSAISTYLQEKAFDRYKFYEYLYMERREISSELREKKIFIIITEKPFTSK